MQKVSILWMDRKSMSRNTYRKRGNEHVLWRQRDNNKKNRY